MGNLYILDGHTPVPEDDLNKWGEWFGKTNRTVRNGVLEVSLGNKKIGQIRISTVFLGVDHSFSGKGPPVLFETMVFGGEHDQEMDRCSTWEAAEKMHEKMIERVKKG